MNRLEIISGRIAQIKPHYLGKCGQCDLEGFLLSGKPCKCLENFRSIVIALYSGVPEEYISYTLDSYPGNDILLSNEKVVKVKNFIRHYIDNMDMRGLFFTGPYGVGKTALQVICMRKYLESKYPKIGVYCTSADMLNAFGHSKYDLRTSLWTVDELMNAECLICDDLGKEYSIGSQGIETGRMKFGMILDQILRYRLSRCLMTHFSSNFTSEQLKTEYGESFTEIAKKMMKFVNFSADFPNLRNPEVTI